MNIFKRIKNTIILSQIEKPHRVGITTGLDLIIAKLEVFPGYPNKSITLGEMRHWLWKQKEYIEKIG